MASLFDINAVKAQAQKQISDELGAKAKDALVRQMRVVATAEQVLLGEKRKQADLEAQIADGTF